MRASRISLIIFLAAVVAVGAATFALAPRRAAIPASSKPRVAATIFPLYDIVRNVAGDAADVTLVLPPGAEPHSFEPTPSNVRDIASSAAVYSIGHGIDGWIDTVTSSGTTSKVTVDRGIALRAAPEAIALTDDGEEEHEGPDDPHYWLTVPNASKIAETVADDLATRFPASAPAFRANLARYRSELAALDVEIRATLAPVKNRDIVTFHDAWYYFADEYGLSIAGAFEPAPGREPTARGLATLKEIIKRHGVRTLYTEPLFSDAAIESFARDEKIGLAEIDDIGGTPGRDSYAALMLRNAETISKNQ